MDWRICEQTVASGQPIEAVYSNVLHLASTFAWHLGHILMGVGVLIVAVQELMLKRRNNLA